MRPSENDDEAEETPDRRARRGTSTFDVEFAQSVFEQAWQALQRLDAGLVGEPRIHYEADAALAAFATLQASDIDLLLVVQVTFTDAAVVTAIAERLDVPLVLWTFPEAAHRREAAPQFVLRRESRLPHAVAAAATRSRTCTARRTARRCCAQIERGREGRDDRARAEGTRILVVGDHPTGFDACNYKADELRATLRRGDGDDAGQASSSTASRPCPTPSPTHRTRAARRTSTTWARWIRSPRARRSRPTRRSRIAPRPKGSRAWQCAAGPSSSPSTAAPPAARSRS